MRTSLCDTLGIEHPIVGFTPSEHVAAAISRAGGLGVLGCVRFNEPDELAATLDWLDENTDGKPSVFASIHCSTVSRSSASLNRTQPSTPRPPALLTAAATFSDGVKTKIG